MSNTILATWDASNKGSNVTLSNENLTAVLASNVGLVRATVGKTTGKWYWEVKFSTLSNATVGIIDETLSSTTTIGSSLHSRMYYSVTGEINAPRASYGVAYTVNDTIGIKLDLDNGILEFLVNNVSQGKITNFKSDFTGLVYPAISSWSSGGGSTSTVNFGGSPFSYTIPSGYISYDGQQGEKSFMVVKNPATNQHYSLEEKTLIPLPNPSNRNIKLYGIGINEEIQLNVDFDKINYLIENVEANKNASGMIIKDLSNKPLTIKFK